MSLFQQQLPEVVPIPIRQEVNFFQFHFKQKLIDDLLNIESFIKTTRITNHWQSKREYRRLSFFQVTKTFLFFFPKRKEKEEEKCR